MMCISRIFLLDTCFYFQGEPSECSGDQVESSLTRVATSSFGGQMPGIANFARSVKSDIDLDNGHQETEAAHFADKKEHSEKSSALLETSSSTQKRPLQSQLIDDNVESDVLEYEVSFLSSQFILPRYLFIALRAPLIIIIIIYFYLYLSIYLLC